MTTKYYALLTNLGAAKLANATALGTQLKLTHLAVGDGGGTLPTPDPAQTQLIGEQRRAPLNSLSVDAANTNQIIAEQIIPENEGGFWIREIGLFDSDGILIAIANCPDTYKPRLQEGSGRTQTVRMILIVNNTEAVTLKIDPTVVLATRLSVDKAAIEVKQYVDKKLAEHLNHANPHMQYLQIDKALAEIKDNDLVDDLFNNLGLGDAATYSVGKDDDQLPNAQQIIKTTVLPGICTRTEIMGKLVILHGKTGGLNFRDYKVEFTLPIAMPTSSYVMLANDGGAGIFIVASQPVSAGICRFFSRNIENHASNLLGFHYICIGTY
ncbi:phage tail protein [Acerihabitans sp. TG2]|uniref:phage tail protein n=1 Tax=Acerihabitans sp. TG2 TaxID=3096008 RepID=UPI002B23B5AC|nr:phage tail protein [Acerihabitans sp. TG2]MEA9393479.1 phage tail protein [Acerihabitans sp. TG2]